MSAQEALHTRCVRWCDGEGERGRLNRGWDSGVSREEEEHIGIKQATRCRFQLGSTSRRREMRYTTGRYMCIIANCSAASGYALRASSPGYAICGALQAPGWPTPGLALPRPGPGQAKLPNLAGSSLNARARAAAAAAAAQCRCLIHGLLCLCICLICHELLPRPLDLLVSSCS